MAFWIACLLILMAVAGIVLLALKMRMAVRKVGFIIGIIALAVFASVMVGYGTLTLLLILAIG